MNDSGLDNLLFLNGVTLVINESGYYYRFVVAAIPKTPEKPHGIDYVLNLHGPDSERLAGFDNAHRVKGQPKDDPRQDHKHRFKTVRPYDYQDAETLLADFYELAESVLKELGEL